MTNTEMNVEIRSLILTLPVSIAIIPNSVLPYMANKEMDFEMWSLTPPESITTIPNCATLLMNRGMNVEMTFLTPPESIMTIPNSVRP